MNAVGLLIVGAILLICAYYVPPDPPPLKVILNILGWICVVVGIILIVALLLHIPTPIGMVVADAYWERSRL